MVLAGEAQFCTRQGGREGGRQGCREGANSRPTLGFKYRLTRPGMTNRYCGTLSYTSVSSVSVDRDSGLCVTVIQTKDKATIPHFLIPLSALQPLLYSSQCPAAVLLS